MPLSQEERAYFEEKFKNLGEKIDAALKYGTRIGALEVEITKRPTTLQVIKACGFFLVLGIALGAALI